MIGIGGELSYFLVSRDYVAGVNFGPYMSYIYIFTYT